MQENNLISDDLYEINKLLDEYNISSVKNGSKLSTLERLKLFIEKSEDSCVSSISSALERNFGYDSDRKYVELYRNELKLKDDFLY